jgi:GH25 family lysozyme M1 (1,4-beta-N-acetylmuramidase)
MKFGTALAATILAVGLTGCGQQVSPRAVPAAAVRPAPPVRGLDVSNWQGPVDWATVARQRPAFAYIKATLGTNFQNPHFRQQYRGATAAKLIRGSYHFALPLRSGGAQQADYFVGHGGGWTRDGRTLPGALDIEYNPYPKHPGYAEYGRNPCYGLSPVALRTWIRDFVTRYRARTGRAAVIYTTTGWWRTCTGNDTEFAARNPLWIAKYRSATACPLPGGWRTHTFWQYSSTGPFPGDSDIFNGTAARLKDFARG